MRNAWLVARREFLCTVRRRSFLGVTLAIPGAIALVILVALLSSGVLSSIRPVGTVDYAGLLQDQAPPADARVRFIAYGDEPAAEAALRSGQLEAYYVIPADYLSRPELRLYTSQEDIPNRASQAFAGYLRSALLNDAPDAVRQRLESGFSVVLRSADGRREMDESAVINIILPIAAGLLFMVAVMMSSGYMLEAVAAEKENRTVEVLATSVSSLQLVGGKALGLLAVVLLQLLIWVLALAIGLIVAARFVPALGEARLPAGLLLTIGLYFVPSYILVAALMTIIGISSDSAREGQQISGILSLLFMFPLFVIMLFFTNPGSPLLVAMTLFPTTAFLTVALRIGLSAVPVWQLIVSWVLLVGSALLCVLVAGRIFRMAMLRYGQPFSLRSIAAMVRLGGR